MKRNLLLLALLITFFSCQKNEPIEEELGENEINLSALKIGQKTFYKGFSSECGNVTAFKYTGDTLVMEIVDTDGSLYLKEYYTNGSPSNSDAQVSFSKISSIQDGLKIQERGQSKFFNFYGSDTLQLKSKGFIDMKQENCIVKMDDEIFRGGELGKIDQFKIGDITISNKTIVSCIPIIEVNGYILYDDQQLFMNYAHFSSSFNGQTTNSITGWIKIK